MNAQKYVSDMEIFYVKKKNLLLQCITMQSTEYENFHLKNNNFARQKTT